jgi:PEGA domain
VRHLVRVGLVFLLAFAVLAPVASAQNVPRPAKKGRKYTVTIDSSPQQAAIYLDDKKYGIVGYTPYKGKLVQGDWKLIVELQGFKPMERQIRVSSSSREFFNPLEKVDVGTLDLQATADPKAAGAEVYIDGEMKGTVPVTIDIKSGRHLLELQKKEFETFKQWVEIKPGEKLTLTPVLKAGIQKGSLLVDADVPGAEVKVDGTPAKDVTPVMITDLEEGPHIVEVKKGDQMVWKQTVNVKAGTTTKVRGELAAAAGGTIRVVANVPDAEVFLDGASKGKAPLDLTGIAAGLHLVEVRARGYAAKEEKVTVAAGTSGIMKFDLVPGGDTVGKMKVVSPTPEAVVFIDGANVGQVPVEKDLSPGEHFVVVEKAGMGKFEQKVVIEGGQTITITAQLRASGGLRFLANVEGVDVFVDGEPVGKTPSVKEDIGTGEHVVTFRKDGYYDEERRVQVEGGKMAILSAEMRLIDNGPTPEDLVRITRGLSSFGAKTMPYGRFTADVGMGYPYWLEAKATVGVMDEPKFGWDVGIGFRTHFSIWEFLLTGRFRLFQKEPFSFGAFVTLGGGGGINGRNEFTFQGGGIATVAFNEFVNVSFRLYADVWSDQLCGKPETGAAVSSSGTDVCTGTATAEETTKANDIHRGKTLYERDSGARLYTSLALEVAFQPRLGMYFIFEGPPFQSERASFSQLFTPLLLSDSDPGYTGRIGLTFKF